MIRTSTFRVSNFGAEYFRAAHDKTYAARDRQHPSMRGRRAFEAARLILRDHAAPYTPLSNLMHHLLANCFNRATVLGTQPSDELSLQFDSQWLENTPKQIAELWCTLHDILPGSSEQRNDFHIMTWLGTLAYAKSADMQAIQSIAMMYRIRDFANIRHPTAEKFDLPQGYAYDATAISRCRSAFQKPFKQSVEAKLPQLGNETRSQHVQRISALFTTRQQSAFNEFNSALKAQWPVSSPSKPQSTAIETYLDIDLAMLSVSELFKAWFDNRCFLQYLRDFTNGMTKVNCVPIPPMRKVTISTIDRVEIGYERHPSSTQGIFAAPPPNPLEECKFKRDQDDAIRSPIKEIHLSNNYYSFEANSTANSRICPRICTPVLRQSASHRSVSYESTTGGSL